MRAFSWNSLRSEEDNHKTKPARHHANSRVRADEHQRQELVACAEDQRVSQRAVGDERDGDSDVEQGEAVEKEVARVRRAVERTELACRLLNSRTGCTYAGAKRSNASRNAMSHAMVYVTFTGNSDAVKSRGNRLTWPATASGRNAPRWRRS